MFGMIIISISFKFDPDPKNMTQMTASNPPELPSHWRHLSSPSATSTPGRKTQGASLEAWLVLLFSIESPIFTAAYIDIDIDTDIDVGIDIDIVVGM